MKLLQIHTPDLEAGSNYIMTCLSGENKDEDEPTTELLDGSQLFDLFNRNQILWDETEEVFHLPSSQSQVDFESFVAIYKIIE